MIDFVRGKLVTFATDKAVLEVNGFGIAVNVPFSDSLSGLTPGEEVTLHTSLFIRDDQMQLYGFNSAAEKKLFNLILGVSGFGPKLSLSLLGFFDAQTFYQAILEENVPLLCQARGIGKKGAMRLILELKEKLPALMAPEDLAAGAKSPAPSVLNETTEALIALGYSPLEAVRASGKAYEKNKDLSVEELLKEALKNMAQSG